MILIRTSFIGNFVKGSFKEPGAYSTYRGCTSMSTEVDILSVWRGWSTHTHRSTKDDILLVHAGNIIKAGYTVYHFSDDL